MEYIDKVLSWPVIIQGALGSLLFYLFFEIAKYLTRKTTIFYGKINKKVRTENLVFKKTQLAANFMTAGSGADLITLCIYGAMNKAAKGFVFLSFALVFMNYIPVFSVVAFVVAIYYFFKALKFVEMEAYSGKSREDYQREIAEIDKELKSLRESQSP